MDQRESERFYWRIETLQSKLKDMPQGAAILTVNNHHFQHFTCPMNLGQQEML